MMPVQCATCKNYDKDLKCSAFSEKIPGEILTGEKLHDKPLPNQGNDIVYEKEK